MKLHLGCGTVVVDGWVNIDNALGLRARKLPLAGPIVGGLGLFRTRWNPDIVIHDIRKPFPWGDGTIDVIYTSNTIEHLKKRDGETCLRECARVLRPGGIVRVVVPNLEGYVRQYLDGRIGARDLLTELNVVDARGLSRLREIVALYSGGSHCCMYDAPAMLALLERIGLSPRVCHPRESAISDVDRFEPAPEEWDQMRRDRNLFVEARK
jgi:SAM-dependent methyltransferase